MKKRREMMESASSDEESSKSYDEEDGKKVSKKRQNSMDSGSDKQSSKKTRRMSRSPSSSGDSSDSISDKEEKSLPKMSPPSPVKQYPVDGNKSDLEEGQISSDDDSNSSSSNSEFDDGYGADLMGNEIDRSYLERLSEKERETELFKRAERRDQLKRRWEIERKLKQTRKVENAKNKRLKKPKKPKVAPKKMPEKAHKPAASSSVEDPAAQAPHLVGPDDQTFDNADEYRDEYFDPKERSKERKKNVEMNKTDDKRSNAMAMLKARREGKQKREVEQAAKQQVEDEKEELEGVAEKSSTKLKARDIYSDDSDSDSEEKASNDGRRSPSSRSSSGSNSDGESQKPVYKKPTFITSLEEMNKLIIKRYMLEKFISLPIFEKTIVGGFVRVNIGNNMETQQIVYRVAEIQAVVETAKIYQFGKMRTNKGLRLKIGTQEKCIRLEFVSNASFTESEFNKWVELCAKADVNLPNVDLIAQKKEDIQAAFNYEFKEEDIDRIIEEKNRFRAYPTNFAMRKTQLMKVC